MRKYWKNLEISEKKYLTALLVVALLLRVIYALSVSLIPADYTGIDLDAVEYDQLGWSVAQGNGYTDVHGDPASTRFPGYPVFLAMVYFFCGHNHQAALLAQALLGAITVFVIYFTARLLFQAKVSRIAGFVAACYPMFIYFVGLLMSENLFFFLLSFLIFFIVSLDKSITWKKLSVTGLILGLLCLVRGNGLPYIGIIPLYIFLRFQGKFWLKFKRATVVLGVAILVLVPWTIRNSLIYNRIMLPASEGGGVLWLAFNNINFTDYYVIEPAFDYVKQVGRENAASEEFYRLLSVNNIFGFTSVKFLFQEFYPDEPLPLSEPEGTKRLGQKAMALLVENPMIWVAKSTKQVFRFWHVLDERGRYTNSYVFILPFFLSGIWLLRRRLKELVPLYLFILVLYGISILFFADARLRMPFEGIFIIIGSFAIHQFLGLFRREYWGWTVIVLFFLCNWFLRLHSLEVRMTIRSFAGWLGFHLAEMD